MGLISLLFYLFLQTGSTYRAAFNLAKESVIKKHTHKTNPSKIVIFLPFTSPLERSELPFPAVPGEDLG
ncbi:MAG: hypothetical protein AUK33_00435 [Flavobacteriaceae bacterium CG2_30_34_30]|nr:MAG: hypothetical protein AUK33_00435 [Flavobacteriaceae bacterium CG2_30_34_30]PIV50450.1 MAG: hypothetical protein COS19_04075 [Flavobacteriaceae bacterium CG02_land_8_20_14_3_00_34_13]